MAFIFGKEGATAGDFEKKEKMLRNLVRKKKLVRGFALDVDVVEQAVQMSRAKLEQRQRDSFGLARS